MYTCSRNRFYFCESTESLTTTRGKGKCYSLSGVKFFRQNTVSSVGCDPHGLQQPRLPCPSPTPGACSNLSIESMVPSNHLILCGHLLPSIFPGIRVFSNESVCIRWPKYWSFSFSISSSNEYSGLISFRVDWFDLAVQGTLRVFSNTTFQKHQFLRCLAFFIVQLSHPYMTTEKTVPLTRRILQWVVIPFWVTSCPGGNLGLPHCRQILYCGSHHLFSML